MPQFSSSRFEQQIELLKKCTGKRWTIREIAKETGISPAYLIFLKNGHRRNPSHEILVKLSHLFGIAPENLLETETDVQTQPQTPQIETGEFTSQTLQFCKQLLLSNNPEQVLQLLSLLESSVTESDSFEAHVEKQLIKASAYVQLGAYDQSEAILSEMQTLPLHDTFVAKLLLVRGYMNTRRGNAAQAITDFQTALQHTEHSKPVELVCLLHMELSQRYKEFDEYGLVIYHVEQTIRHLPEQADDKKRAHLYVELGRIHLKVMSLTAASQALTTAASFHTLQQDLSLQGEILYLMSKVKYFQKDYEHAIQLLESGMQLRQQIGDHAGIAACLLDMAACQLKFEQWEAGETCAQRAVISFENMNDHVQIARAKLLQVEALFHLHGDANRLLSILTAVCNEFEHLQCWLDLAAAHRLKADLLNHLGLCEEALASSMLALQLYKTCEPEHFLPTLQPN